MRLAGSGSGAEQKDGNGRWIPPDLVLKLSTARTVSAVFHLNNKEAKRELRVNHNNETLPFCSEPKHLGVTLDRSLTYRRHQGRSQDFSKGGAEVMEAKALKRKNCLWLE